MLQGISAEDIAYAEGILFGGNGQFDPERIAFIECLKTTDLQAVPGSGKTTVLLAKLLIIERRLPLKNNAGVAVLSHTNIAVDEIRDRIGIYCPKLFSYPNFIGTIQSFVNQFMAMPFYENHFGSRVLRIDNEVYDEELNKHLGYCLEKQVFEVYKKVLRIKNANFDLIRNFRFDLVDNVVVLVNHINGQALEVTKPKGNTKKENYQDFTPEEKQEVVAYLTELKSQCLKAGTLHFDDAYFLAKLYLKRKPMAANYIRLRFPYVFVDEMQDMEKHQFELLEQLFHTGASDICYQRIGDINQCIFSEHSVDLANIWQGRPESLTIAGSHRLTAQVAKIVQNFGAKKLVPINGLNQANNLKPHIILFHPELIGMVIQIFGDLILSYQKAGRIPESSVHPIRVIGWNGKEPEPGKLRIKNYYPGYQSTTTIPKIDFLNLYSYLIFYNKESLTLEPIRKNILHAILRILRIEKIRNGEKYFRTSTLLGLLKADHVEVYESITSMLYNCCLSVIKGDIDPAHSILCDFIPKFIYSAFTHQLSPEAVDFLQSKTVVQPDAAPAKVPNSLVHKTLNMTIGTVHSVKGETHLATLYLDTCYFKHESEKSVSQLLGQDASLEIKSRIQDSAKMMYVGLSRATHLVCYAVSQQFLGDKEDELTASGWEVIKI